VKIEVSKLGAIFGYALYDELKKAISDMSYIDEQRTKSVRLNDALLAIKIVLGVDD
jgi:hypothetical protein